MPHRRRRPATATIAMAAAAALTLGLAACSDPGQSPASGATGAAGSAGSSTELVLADAYELGGFNPIGGYGELGVSPLYDGLMGLKSNGPDKLPDVVPALAAEAPVSNAELTSWTVKIREGVTFHDGTPFDVADVVDTYTAVLDPASASDIAHAFDMVKSVAPTPNTPNSVTFELNYPYSQFPSRLLLAIAPSEKIMKDGKVIGTAEASSLNREPVGTGPYKLAELTAERAVFTANEAYFKGAPQITKLTTVYLPDDNARAQRMTAGEFDGTVLPPALAKSFEGKDGYQIDAPDSADWRGVSFASGVEFTKSPAVRRALNMAVDRKTIIESVLAGRGVLAETPVAPVYGDAFEPNATFPYDVEGAKKILADEGWAPGADGILAKGGERAAFTIAYKPSDTVRRDLSTAFQGEMAKIGIEVKLEGLTFDKIEPRVSELGILLGGGDKPYSLDTQLHAALHSRMPGAASWDNPSGYATEAMDAALDSARKVVDDSARAADYRKVQMEYIQDPSYVMFAFLNHTYVSKKDDTWNRGELTVEPHSHGIGWGPWWNLGSWTK